MGQILEQILLNPNDYKTLLYLGSGGINNSHFIWMPFMSKIPNRLAVDMNYDALSTLIPHGWGTLAADIRNLTVFPDKSYDIVFALDIIEHLHKGDGRHLLHEIDRIAKKVSVVFTPVGFIDVRIYQAELIKNEYDIHNSGWEPEELKEFGYSVQIHSALHCFKDKAFDGMTGVKIYGDS